MANTVISAGGVFPNGTTVKAYKAVEAENFARAGSPVSGLSAVETQTIASGGATFTTLTAGAPYIVYAKTGAVLSTVSRTATGTTGVNEVDVVTLKGIDSKPISGGTFTLSANVDGGGVQTTAAIAWDASAADVQAALEALSNLAPGDVVVTGARGGPYTLTFGGAAAELPVVVTVDASNLTGATEHRFVHVSGSA